MTPVCVGATAWGAFTCLPACTQARTHAGRQACERPHGGGSHAAPRLPPHSHPASRPPPPPRPHARAHTHTHTHTHTHASSPRFAPISARPGPTSCDNAASTRTVSDCSLQGGGEGWAGSRGSVGVRYAWHGMVGLIGSPKHAPIGNGQPLSGWPHVWEAAGDSTRPQSGRSLPQTRPTPPRPCTPHPPPVRQRRLCVVELNAGLGLHVLRGARGRRAQPHAALGQLALAASLVVVVQGVEGV
jgi:hypothetical protein